jgi:hypothetical protein
MTIERNDNVDLRDLRRVCDIVFETIASLSANDPLRERSIRELHAAVGRIVDYAHGNPREAKQADLLLAKIIASSSGERF